MTSLAVHSFVNVGLNLLTALVVVVTLFLPFFAVGDYSFSLASLSHSLKFEDVQGEVTVTFSHFLSFACPLSQQSDILLVCDELPGFQIAGRLYSFIAALLLFSFAASLLDLLLVIVLNRKVETQMQVCHYVNCPLAVSGIAVYLMVCGMGDKEVLAGVFAMCVLAAMSILTLAHYMYVQYLAKLRRIEEARSKGQGTKTDFSQFSADDLKRELEMKTEALAGAQAKLAEQGVYSRSSKDQSAEYAILQKENQNLEMYLAQLQSDVETGVSGNERNLLHRFSESERLRRELDRKMIELKYENARLRDASEPAIIELLNSKDRRIQELEGQQESDPIRKQQSPKQLAGADEQQREVMFQDSTFTDAEKEKADLVSKAQRLEETQRKLSEENAQLVYTLTTEQQTVKSFKAQISSLQDQLQAALANIGVQKDVDEVRGLLEESRRKEMEDMKGIYEQRYNAMIDDQHELRSKLDAARAEATKNEISLAENRKKREDVETQVKSLDEELRALRRHLNEAEQQNRDTTTTHLRMEFDLKKKTTELEILREQIQSIEDTHAKAIAELTNSRGDQLEAIKKLYAEASQKDYNDRIAIYTSRIEKLQSDLETERLSKERIDAQCSSFELENRINSKRVSDLTTHVANQSTQIEELLIKLAHIQTLLKQATDENANSKRTLLEKTESLRVLENIQDDIQRANSKVLRDQEARHEKEVDRMKELYEVSQAKEMDELKKFYEQKIGKIHGDLVNERQERLQAIDQADRVTKDKEKLEIEITHLSDQLDRQKQKVADTEERLGEDIHALQRTKSDLEKIIAALRSEISSLKAASISPEVHQELQDRFAQASVALRDKETSIKDLQKSIEELENGANVSAAIKEEVRQLRENAEKTSDELTVVRRELAAREQEIQRISTLQTKGELAKSEIDALLNATQMQKSEIERQSKIFREKLERKRQRLTKARNQLQQVASERDKQYQELTEGYKLEKEKLKQTYVDIFQQDLDDIKQRYENKILSLNSELKSHQSECMSHGSKIAELNFEKSKLLKSNKDLSEEASDTKQNIDNLLQQLSELKSRDETLQVENENLKSLLESLKKARGDQHTQVVESLEAQLAELTRANRTHSFVSETSQKELEDAKNELKQKEGELQNVKEECMALHTELLEMKDKRPRSKSSTSFSRDDRRSGMTPDSSQSVKEIMIIDGMSGPERDSNPILEKVSKLKKEAPMTYTNVWKFFENLMQEKCKLDRLEMSLGRQPRTMTEFMLDFVYLHYGLKTLALKQLQALVTSLQELYKSAHVYGILFCRFIGVFHPRPLPHHLAVYLLVVGEEFSSLMDRNKPRRSEKFADQYDLLQYGGQASVIDLMELIVKICKGNREAGERVISQLFPDSENRIEVILFKVCGTMARMGKDPKYIFEILDLDQGGAVDYHELVDGIRFKLNIWVTQDEAVELCGFIDEAGTGQIMLEDWTAKVSFADYMDRSSGVGNVTKANFLNALITEYEYAVVQDYYTLRHMIKRSYMDQDAIEDFLMQVDPGLDEKDLVKFYEEILQYESDPRGGISPETACIVVLKHRIGGFGVGIFGECLHRPGLAGPDLAQEPD